MDHKCLDCKEILTDTELRDFGDHCDACIVKHQTSCKYRDCVACKRSKCWECSGALEKMHPNIKVDKKQPYPDWIWKCRDCGKFQVKCKFCRTTTVDFWYGCECSKVWDECDCGYNEVWDDIGICESCGAPFCPCCNQSEYGCKLIDDEDIYCRGCIQVGKVQMPQTN